jgi:putative YphP/YqiW family bacilliredoxin
MYPEQIVKPMKQDLTVAGFEELLTPEHVDAAMKRAGTTLLVINSVCGCAAGMARPGVKHAIATSNKKPDFITTSFAGFDVDAVAQARRYMLPYPASSPSMALFKDGKLVHFIERHHIEGKSAEMVAENLKAAFEEYC